MDFVHYLSRCFFFISPACTWQHGTRKYWYNMPLTIKNTYAPIKFVYSEFHAVIKKDHYSNKSNSISHKKTFIHVGLRTSTVIYFNYIIRFTKYLSFRNFGGFANYFRICFRFNDTIFKCQTGADVLFVVRVGGKYYSNHAKDDKGNSSRTYRIKIGSYTGFLTGCVFRGTDKSPPPHRQKPPRHKQPRQKPTQYATKATPN